MRRSGGKGKILNAYDLPEDTDTIMLKRSSIKEKAACSDACPASCSNNKTEKERKDKMSRQIWKPGNMLYPLPAVMVSTADKEGNSNIITIAWTGTVCTNPAMVYISVRPERYSYHMIKESGEFVINLTTEKLTKATDYCGVRSGENVDKWKECRLTQGKASSLEFAPIIEESPVNIECKVKKMEELGSHHMFLAEVTAVQVDDSYMDDNGKFMLNNTGLIAYSHGEYLSLGEKLGQFGYKCEKKEKADKEKIRNEITSGGRSLMNVVSLFQMTENDKIKI